ncbi:amino acid adenylation domain-containing protein [Dyella sp.]|uniref:non-ribosomal peptide synthetase n=1 Tax=Dyella sp. TaxID=1869338 RepID=UPI002ED64A23
MSSQDLRSSLLQSSDVLPLSSPQLDIFHDHLMKGSTPAYNIGGYLDFHGSMDIQRFEKALNLAIRKHDSLRIMLMAGDDDLPGQRIMADMPADLMLLDFSQDASPDDSARTWMRNSMNQPFVLVGAPLFRHALIKLADAHYQWFICVHHLIADGWAMDTLFQSFAGLYSALEQGEEPQLAAPSYARFVESDRLYQASASFTKDRDYWHEKYRDLPDPLLLARHAVHDQTPISGEHVWRLDDALNARIDDLATTHQSTRFQVVLAIFHAFFQRLHQREELVIGLSVLNRKDADARRTVGMFTNVSAMRLAFDLRGSFVDLLKAIAPSLRQDYRHQRFPIGQLNKGLGLFARQRDQLYELSISYENGGVPLRFGDVTAFVFKCTNDYESTPLRLCVRDDLHRRETSLFFIFGHAYYSQAEIAVLQDRFMRFTQALLADPQSSLDSLPIVTPQERAQFDAWNATAIDYPQDACVHACFEQQAARRPDAIALVHEDTSLTYAEVDARANQLAQHLIALGVGPDDRVALCAARQPATIVAMLAILKAGGAYVPIDPSYPAERVAYVLGDAQPRLLLADRAGRQALGAPPAQLPVLDLDGAALAWASLSRERPQVEGLDSRRLAYVIYTSGSTGQPKGVMVEHRQVCHQVTALRHAYQFTADDRLLQFASIAFDMSVEEIFPALLTGATLVLRTDACLESPAAFAAFCAVHQLTYLNLPSTFWAQLALAQPELELPVCLRQVSAGGDAMSLAAASAWLRRQSHRPALFNAYGPTETTVNATMLAVDRPMEVSCIGRPIANTRAYLLDAYRQPVPVGAVGELYIGGAGVARGYLDRPQLTMERFLSDPFSPVADARMYRTGDLARFLPDGNIEFLGRNDHQVKIRGYRIELGEIETRLANHRQVHEAVVLARGESHDRRLVAYVVGDGDANDLRAHLAVELPPYMIPSAFVRLDAFPLTPNGKLDRKALPEPDEAAFAHRAYEAPRDGIEASLAQLWCQLLDLARVGRHDHFFELGGHSLIAIRLLGKVSQQFGVSLPLASLFNHPTLAALAEAIASDHDGAGTATLPPIVAVSHGDHIPLSYAQQRLWFMAQLDQANATYHVSLVLQLEGALDIPALQQALDRLLHRHEALRTVFHAIDGEPRASLLPAHTPFPLVVHDLRQSPHADELLARYKHDHAHAAYDMEHGPLVRANVIRLGDRRHVLQLGMHHIVSDGWSINLLAREINALYVAFAQGQADPLPALRVQYPDYAAWQHTVLSSERLRDQAAYWKDALHGAPDLLHLPTDHPRPSRQSFAGAMRPIRLDVALTRRLRQLGKQHGMSLYMLVTAAWAAVLARLSGQDDVMIGTLSANRGQREIEPLIGFFVSTLPLRIDLSGEPDALTLLSRVRRTTLAAQENQDLPFEQIVDIAKPSRRLDHSPLFQVLFAWQSNDKTGFELPGLTISQSPMSLESIRYDLELHLYETEDAIVGGLGYATALFDETTIDRHIGYLSTTLEAMVADPATALRVPLPDSHELAQLARWNDTAVDPVSVDAIHRLFEQHAASSPQATALICDDQALSYGALNARANQWARHLRSLGVGTGVRSDPRIALCAERGFDMICALLAILKAGACYVPLDPSYPSERLRQVLSEAGAELVLHDTAGHEALGVSSLARYRCVDIGELAMHGTDLAEENLPSPEGTDASSLAYVIYTSGSTGTPKGVAMPHRPLVNLVQWQLAEAVKAGLPAPKTLQFAALGFDVAFQEIFTTLCAGASLVLVDTRTRMQFGKLIALLRHQRVQRVFLPYIALQALAEAAEDIRDDGTALLPELRAIIVAGEQLRLTPQIQRLFTRLPACDLHNHYGPTETHVVTAQVLPAGSIATSLPHVPIGRPIANARTYVLDGHGQPVPVGVAGELYIGGLSIARGYLGRDDLTAARFLADPFDTRTGARMYRTGDLARHLPDGRLIFLGRNDHQVKLRGFRIELGEIEARLAEHASVRECAVIARNDAQGEIQLVAYVVAGSHADDNPATWHAYLAATLPAYMVPAAFVTLEAIPLTAHGKLDRQALPAPDEQALVRAHYEAPRGDVETRLAALWQDLLGVAQVGRRDQFFELGGHSLIAVRLLSRIAQAFGASLPLADLFAWPVLHDLAARIAQQQRSTPHQQTGIPRATRGEMLPLSHAQQRLWFLAQLDGDSATYHIPIAVQLDGPLDVPALREALQQVFARHESLRTVFVARHGQPHARLLDSNAEVALHQHDLRHYGASERVDAATILLARERNRPFDLAAGPLLRASLLRTEEQQHVLQLTLHHIVADGWSLGILSRELGACYAQAQGSRSDMLAPLPIQYADYAAWEHGWLVSERMLEQVTFWQDQLAGSPSLLELPTDRPRPARQSFEGAFVPIELDANLTQDLKRLAQHHGATLFMIVLAAWALVLSRLSGQRDIVIGTPTAGRGRPELESLIGFFVNTLPLRIDLHEATDVASLLRHVRTIALDAQAHQELPFERIVELAKVPRRIDHTPLVQVLLAWQSHDEGSWNLPGMTATPAHGDFDWVKFDQELILSDADGHIRGGINYATALFDRSTIERHAGYLRNVLKAMAAGDTRPLHRIPMLADDEREQLIEMWNRTDMAVESLCLHQQVERHAHESPHSLALVSQQEQVTYADLNARANHLAHHLARMAVRPGDRVALCVEKGVSMFVGLLAIMKAGGVYVPLDPAYASARLDHILLDATPRLLLCDEIGREALGAGARGRLPALDMDQASAWEHEPGDNPAVPGLDARALAYVIYTSGSTGAPKGVMVEHHGIINLGHSLGERLGIDADSRISQFASAGFDASIFECSMAFTAGAALYLPSVAERQSPSAFMAFIGRQRITHATLPPAFLQGHAEAPCWAHRPMLIFAGDASSPGLFRHWSRYARLANAYGPTEITVCASTWVCPDEPGELSVVPVGRPIGNTRLYLLDEHGLPVPRGSIGELYIGGANVARGYLDRPALNAERFVSDPFDDKPQARMYRSGDLMRYLPDGNLVFLGRNDHQVKLRGFRIELGEIEANLASHAAVRECVVLAREDVPGDKRLVAYVVLDKPAANAIAQLREHLAKRLPEYMVPTAFVAMEAMPLTSHGKLDRKALPAPGDQAFARRTYAPPQGVAEHAIATLWGELLGVERIGRHDHFFELGGHSLLVTRLAARMHEQFDKPVAVRDLFNHPVLKDMAALISSNKSRDHDMLDLDAELVLDETIRASSAPRQGDEPQHILLTGASGFLGAFLLVRLLECSRAVVHCLVRGDDDADARARLDANMRQLGLDEYERARVSVIAGDLALPLLGQDRTRFDHLANLIDVIYHNGAWVNSLHTYESLKAANVLGTQEILRLAAQGTPKHVHYVSTLSTIPLAQTAGVHVTTESELAEHWRGLASGYAQSKWVAERLLRIGGERGIPYTIYRPTHIGAARDSGASNPSDTWSLFIDACLRLERVPEVDTGINSLPVDYMSACIVELSMRDDIHGRSFNLASMQSFQLSELTRQIAAIEELSVKTVDYRAWRRQCAAQPATSRLAAVMPAELVEEDAEEPSRIPLGNAVEDLSRHGMPCPAPSTETLRKYVRWRYRQSVQPA